MIVFDLTCPENHTFEAWFKDSSAYEEQLRQGLIECPVCGSRDVKKVLAPVAHLSRSGGGTDGPGMEASLLRLMARAYEAVVKQTKDVGPDFAKEALKMHHGLKEPESIRGVATPEEEQLLKEEGVEFIKLPVVRRRTEGN